MAQRMVQKRLGTNNDNITAEELISPPGVTFQHISQLSIETEPGVQFYIDNQLEPYIIGVTGIYEIYLNDNTISLRFDRASIEQIEAHNQRIEETIPNRFARDGKRQSVVISMLYEEESEDGETTIPDTV